MKTPSCKQSGISAPTSHITLLVTFFFSVLKMTDRFASRNLFDVWGFVEHFEGAYLWILDHQKFTRTIGHHSLALDEKFLEYFPPEFLFN